MAVTADVLQAEIRARDRASKQIEKVRGRLDAATASVKRLSAASGLLGAVGGVAALGFIQSSIKAAAEQRTVFNRLRLSIERLGGNYDALAGDINAFATELQATTRFGDDETAKVLTTLISLTGSYGEHTKQATLAVLDFAEGAMQGKALPAAKLVSQAIAGNISALSRYLPALRGVNAETFAAKTAAERTQFVVDALAKAFGGSAKAIDATQQSMAQFKNTSGDVKEALGDLLTSGGLFLRAVTAINERLGQLGAVLATLEKPADGLSAAFKLWVETSPGLTTTLAAADAAGLSLGDSLGNVLKPSLEDTEAQAAKTKKAMEELAAAMPDVLGADSGKASKDAQDRMRADEKAAKAAAAARKSEADERKRAGAERRQAEQQELDDALAFVAQRQAELQRIAEAGRPVDLFGTEGFMPAEGQLGEEMGPPDPGIAARSEAIERLRVETELAENAMQNFAKMGGQLAATAAVDALTQSLFAMAVAGEFSASALAESMLKAVGQVATQMGTMLILSGTGLALIPGMQKSAGAVAAGIGLVALGASLGAAAGALGRGGSGSDRGAGRTAPGSVGAFAGAGETAAAGQGAGGGNVTLVLNTGQSLATRGEIARDVATLLHEGRRARSVPVGSQFRR